MFKLTLCNNKCCPEVNIIQGQVVISDDYGGKVTLTPAELSILVQRYPEIKGAL